MVKKKSKEAVNETGKEITINREQLFPATIVEAKAGKDYGVDVPEFLKQEGVFTREAPSGFTPLIQFGQSADSWQPGSWIIAKFIGVRDNVGPNASMMYEFEVTPDGKTFTPASLWGSTIYDNKFRLLSAKPGDWIFMQYLGVTETSRKQNPAKDFRLAVVDEKIIKGMGYQS